jgi:hypothetical protein
MTTCTDIRPPAPSTWSGLRTGNGMTASRRERVALALPQPSMAAEAIAAAIGRLELHPEDVAHLCYAMATATNKVNKHLALVGKVVDSLDELADSIENDLREQSTGG